MTFKRAALATWQVRVAPRRVPRCVYVCVDRQVEEEDQGVVVVLSWGASSGADQLQLRLLERASPWASPKGPSAAAAVAAPRVAHRTVVVGAAPGRW